MKDYFVRAIVCIILVFAAFKLLAYDQTQAAHQAQPRVPREPIAFYTFIASNSLNYVRLAACQHYAFLVLCPEQPHYIMFSNKVDKRIEDKMKRFMNASTIRVDALEDSTPKESSSWVDQLTKLHLWNFTQHDLICYLDADVVFHQNITAILANVCWDAFKADNNTQLCTLEQGCGDGNFGWNREHWGTRYFQASRFCLRPNKEIYLDFVKEGLLELQKQGSLIYKGKKVITEQDFLNLYFKGRVYYLDCSLERNLIHTKDEGEFIRTHPLPPQYSLQFFDD